MNWTVIIRPRAEADLQEACAWYESQRAGLGDEFLAEVDAAVRFLERSPQQRALYYRGFRRLLTRRFPYKLFYRLEGRVVLVFRILHASREHRRALHGRS